MQQHPRPKRTKIQATPEDIREMVIGFLRHETLTDIGKRLGRKDPGFAFNWRQMWRGKKPISDRMKKRIPADLLPLFGSGVNPPFRIDDDEVITEAIAVNKTSLLEVPNTRPKTLARCGSATGIEMGRFRHQWKDGQDPCVVCGVSRLAAQRMATSALTAPTQEPLPKVAESVAADRNAEVTEDDMAQLAVGLQEIANEMRRSAARLDDMQPMIHRIKDTKEVLEKLKGLLD